MCYGLKQQRHFNVRLNGELVLPELEILLYVSHCQGMDIFTVFHVRNGYLTLPGIQSSKISNDDLALLQFCYGDGEPGPYYDPSYVVASIYIIELAPNDKPMPTLPTTATTKVASTTEVMESTTDKEPMTTTDPDMDSTTDPGVTPTTTTTKLTTIAPDRTTKWITTAMTSIITTKRKTTTPISILSTTLKPVPPGPQPTFPPGDVVCREAREKSICHCVDPHNYCDSIYQPGGSYGEYNCVGRQIFCRGLNEENFFRFFPGTSCKRARATYSYGGFICNFEFKAAGSTLPYNKEDEGDCDILKTILAVRCNGNDTFKDARDVVYVPMSQKPPNNPTDYEFNYNTLGQSHGAATLCHESSAPKRFLNPKDRPLWIHYVTGKNKNSGPFCFNYTIPIEEDGSYELNVKTIEYESAEKDERAFNIFLNGIHVFREIELIKIWSAICVPIELISVFEVSGGVTMVSPRGFPTYPIQAGGMEVAFCNGQCTTFARQQFHFHGVHFQL